MTSATGIHELTQVPHCDAPLAAAAIKDGWCPECEKAIPQIAQPADPAPKKPPETATRQGNRPMIVLIVVILVLALPLGLLYGMARDGKLGRFGTVFVWVGVGANVLLGLASLLHFILTDETDSSPDD